MSRDREQQAERGGARRLQRQEGMGGVAGEQGPRPLPAEGGREARGGPEPPEGEPRHHERMARRAERRRQHIVGELSPDANERRMKPPPVIAPRAQPVRGRVERALQDRGGAVVERVRQGRRRLDPRESQVGQREGAEERRGEGERVDRGADVVGEPRQGELVGPEAATHRRLRFPEQRPDPGARQGDRGREPVGTRPDNHGVRCPHGAFLNLRAARPREWRAAGP